jgi:hypothetical protein
MGCGGHLALLYEETLRQDALAQQEAVVQQQPVTWTSAGIGIGF